MLTKRAAVDGDPESFPWNRRRCALSEHKSADDGTSLREAALWQYVLFLPINGATSLTRRPERISK
jgi:hypothetical protein